MTNSDMVLLALFSITGIVGIQICLYFILKTLNVQREINDLNNFRLTRLEEAVHYMVNKNDL